MPNANDVIEQLRSLGFRASKEALRALLEEATKSRLSPMQLVEKLATLERRERETRNLAQRTKTAALGTFKTLDRFDWNHPRAIDRELYERLATTLDFLEVGNNVLLRGQSGVGKTTLAQNLGLAALAHGYTVRFTTLALCMADLLKQESVPALERRLRRYTHVDLLLCDELGYLPFDSRSADLLYNIITRRHEARSTVITTNLAFKQWGTIFPGAACIAALIDRFAQNCQVIDIDAESWRQKNPPPQPPSTSTPTRRRTAHQ